MAKLIFQAPGFQWSFYQINMGKRFFEIDIQPFNVSQTALDKRLFKTGHVPRANVSGLGRLVLTFDWETRIADWGRKRAGMVRVRVSWSGNQLLLASEMREPFPYILIHPWWFTKGWERRAADERMAHAIWMATPEKAFGGRTPREMLQLGPGAYEVKGEGFVWVSAYEIQSQPYLETVNSDIRWYLEHGTDLGEALRLTRDQWQQLSTEMMLGFVCALSQVGSKGDPDQTILDKSIKTGDTAIKFHGAATNSRSLYDVIQDKYAKSQTEQRIQELAARPRIPITKLEPIRTAAN